MIRRIGRVKMVILLKLIVYILISTVNKTPTTTVMTTRKITKFLWKQNTILSQKRNINIIIPVSKYSIDLHLQNQHGFSRKIHTAQWNIRSRSKLIQTAIVILSSTEVPNTYFGEMMVSSANGPRRT